MPKHDTSMPLDIAAFTAATATMSHAFRGIYVALLVEYWRHGPITAEDAKAVSGLSGDAWEDALPILRRAFAEVGGYWRHQGLDSARESASRRSERLSKAGRKGARIKRRLVSAAPIQSKSKPGYSLARKSSSDMWLQNNREQESVTVSLARISSDISKMDSKVRTVIDIEHQKTASFEPEIEALSISDADAISQVIDNDEDSSLACVFENGSSKSLHVVDMQEFVDKKGERRGGDYRGGVDRGSLRLGSREELNPRIKTCEVGDRAKHLVLDGSPPQSDDLVRQVYDHWVAVMGKERSKLTDGRREKIAARLKEGYTAGELIAAIDGCARSPHHMGANDAGKRYDDLELICRNGSKVESFRDMPTIEEQERARSRGKRKTASDEMWEVLQDVWEPDFWAQLKQGE